MMHAFSRMALVLAFSISSIFAVAQCTDCVVQDSLCPPSGTGTDVVLCGNDFFSDTAGTDFEANVTFLFNTGFVVRQGDDLFAAFGVPLPIPFPAPFDITVYVERGTLNSISGLPAGVTWETDSTANGNNYTPFMTNKGCVKLCGNLACGIADTFNVVMNFTTVARQNLSGVSGLPPGIIPDSTVSDYDVPLTIVVDPSTNLVLSVSTAGPTTVIDSGQSITLNGTSGFDSYSWSSGETAETITVSPADTTTYVLTATDALGCQQTDSIEVQVLALVDSVPNDTTGITAIGYNDPTVQVHPNPTHGKFTVIIAQLIADGAMIEVFDITGKRVLAQPIISLNNTLNLDTPKGLYIVKVINGGNIYTRKLILH